MSWKSVEDVLNTFKPNKLTGKWSWFDGLPTIEEVRSGAFDIGNQDSQKLQDIVDDGVWMYF